MTTLLLVAAIVVAALLLLYLLLAVKIVPEYQRAVIFRLGRITEARGPGLFMIIPWVPIELLRLVDSLRPPSASGESR